MAKRRKYTAQDEQAAEFGRSAAKRFHTGPHTATQTGARSLAQQRGHLRAMAELSKAATHGTEPFEGFIEKGRFEKPKRRGR